MIELLGPAGEITFGNISHHVRYPLGLIISTAEC